jgi:bifunctional UDP-N-acetylglucosamine pyrophosphorylase / glucosamine-1-phosphate N-acetyltransferase
MSICAVIPAAGRGTRLGTERAKILTSLTPRDTIWSILYAKLEPLVDHIHLVLSPEGAAQFPSLPDNVSVSIQPDPVGMGDAVFRGFDVWSNFDALLIVWGDQVFVSIDTLERVIAASGSRDSHVVLPLTRMAMPYVEYVFCGPLLTKVLQTREGDITAANGFSDVGTFLLSTRNLRPAWENYLKNTQRGSGSGEINFLPFLPFLSAHGWTVAPLEVANAIEARGVNTKDDLAFFQSLYNKAP